MKILLLLVGVALLTGCSTIVNGTTQNIMVASEPPGAVCNFNRRDKDIGVVNPTPGMLTITRDAAILGVFCVKEGYYPGGGSLSPSMEAMSFGNALFGGIIGIIVDASSGANMKYDTSITIKMKKIDPTSSDLQSVIDEIKKQ